MAWDYMSGPEYKRRAAASGITSTGFAIPPANFNAQNVRADQARRADMQALLNTLFQGSALGRIGSGGEQSFSPLSGGFGRPPGGYRLSGALARIGRIR